MTISTFSNLKTVAENWLARVGDTTISDRAAEYIALCEARINRKLRTLDMETRATLTLTSGTEYYLQPTSFGGLRGRPKITSTNPQTFLTYMTPSQLDQIRASTTTGTPKVISIVGNEFRLRPIPDSGYTLEISYYLKVPALSGSNETNWLLTNHPDIYLYGTLLQAEAHIQDDHRLVIWKAAYDEALEELEDMDRQDRWSGVPLQQRSDVLTV